MRYLASYLAELFSKDNRSVLIFGSVPMAFYVFDYLASVYTDIWFMQAKTTVELLAFVDDDGLMDKCGHGCWV